MLKTLNHILVLYEKFPSLPFISTAVPIRQAAIDRVYQMITYEDENTTYQTLGPVSKSFNMVARFHREGSSSDAFKMHQSRVADFLWLSKDGMFMTGTNGSQVWDIAFLAQALVETGLAEEKENSETVKGMLDWLDKAQIKEDPKWYKEGYRHRSKGAWPFSTPEQSYTVSPRITGSSCRVVCRSVQSGV